MTKIQHDQKLQISALMAANINYTLIARQLNLNVNTVKQHIRRLKLVAGLPPKIIPSKTIVKGRMPLQIKTYLFDNPTATLQQVIAALDLNISPSTLSRFLAHNNYEKRAAAPAPILRETNRINRLDFCRQMLAKDDDYLRSIFWTDEFTVQTWPNDEILFYWTPKDSTVHGHLKSAKVKWWISHHVLG